MSTVLQRKSVTRKGRPAAPREAFLGRISSWLGDNQTATKPLHVALVNNMADMALSRTELQFMDLLQQAAGETPVRLSLYSLPVIERGERGRQHLAASYRPIEDLWRHPPDAVVVSGAEPREADLRNERYWPELTALFDWIEAAGIPALFSCLAAHAALLHCDGIARTPLAAKCFGIFDGEVAGGLALTDGVGPSLAMPHTRWNVVEEAPLIAAGYEILSRSPDVGAGFFARRRGGVWLMSQGHPEYDGPSLFREHRRDVLRFLRREREAYPDLPRGYFTPDVRPDFEAFRDRALAGADETLMKCFPAEPVSGPNWESWKPGSIAIVRNWLSSAVGETGH
jgi:homoserine O-succinyltransferase